MAFRACNKTPPRSEGRITCPRSPFYGQEDWICKHSPTWLLSICIDECFGDFAIVDANPLPLTASGRALMDGRQPPVFRCLGVAVGHAAKTAAIVLHRFLRVASD